MIPQTLQRHGQSPVSYQEFNRGYRIGTAGENEVQNNYDHLG